MKNIAVFAVLVIIFFTLFANKGVYCHELSNYAFQKKERKYGFSVGPQFGMLYGQVLELVYPVETNGKLLSELRWDMKPVFYAGAFFDFGLKDIYSSPGFFTSISFNVGIGGDSGYMEDRDWMSKDNEELTNFSKHINKTTEFFWLEFTAGASLPIKSFLYIKPLIGFSWIRFSFTARDGYLMYKINNFKEEPISGECISYLQDWLVVVPGFIIGTKSLYPFTIDLSFKISPLTFTGSTDDHILRKETYLDYTRFGLFIESGGRFSFSTGRMDFSFDFTYHFTGRTRGETYTNYWNRNDDKYYLEKNQAGASFSLLDIRTLIKICI